MINIAREASFPTPLAYSPLLPLMLFSLAKQKNSPSPLKEPSAIHTEYDYIIVGADSAGATLAGRMSEVPCVKILLLEAGEAPPYLNDIPGFGKNFWYSSIDWQYRTVPQKHTARLNTNRKVPWPSGKGLGGSSLLNDMLYLRGNKKDYDDWAAQGAEGWSYDEVLPYFLKLEDNKNFDILTNGYHAAGGPVSVQRPYFRSIIEDPILKTAVSMGYDIVDPNGAKQTGFYRYQSTMRNGQRCSTAKAYLVSAENRNNLDIVPNAFVTKVHIKNKKAVGVSFEVNGTVYNIKAKREVILSAGAVRSPQLLMLSGIGPRKDLKKHKIPVIADLPVGHNLQDHVTATINFELDPKYLTMPEQLSNLGNILQYIKYRQGPLCSAEFDSLIAFVRGTEIRPKIDFPDIELYFLENIPPKTFELEEFAYNQIYKPYESKPFYSCISQIQRPKSRGTIKLQSANPHDYPEIDPNYYANIEDVRSVVNGLKVCYKIGTSEALKAIGSKPFNTTIPGCEKFVKNKDRYFECLVRSIAFTISHYTSSVKMGSLHDNTAVLDPQLRVKGIQGLRVVDASIMPNIISGNTNIPTIMIAEKAADMIKETIKCSMPFGYGCITERCFQGL